MSIGFVGKVKGFILDPTQTLIAHKDERLGDALRYSAILLTIFLAIYGGALNGVIPGLETGVYIAFLSAGLDPPFGADSLASLGIFRVIIASIISIISTIIYGVAILFIAGIIFHIFVYIAGGRKNFSTTIRAVIYAATPSLLFLWIPPLIGLIAIPWSLALVILAIRELHEISTSRAVIATILPIILIFILTALSLAAFIFSDPTITPY
ncbi:YIP1 family protein [Methanogenium cariaci]|uniref:YIP1 family protein n=1 Tax=Methanogenium cariaci TaxID=2197 RepID=UPI00078180AA|nr:YIP1 family protein [Methanogenium cariaci]